MQSTCEVKALRLERGEMLSTSELVVEEYPLTIKVNGQRTANVLCSPSDLEQLALGFLLAEGVIADRSEVARVDISGESHMAEVWLNDAEYTPLQPGDRAKSSGCGLGAVYLEAIATCSPSQSTARFLARTILLLSREFNRMSELFLSTGGVHSAALCFQDDILIFHEDIGRHNAVDKVVGSAAIRGVDLTDKLLLCSGRISSEMLLKAAKQSIPVVVSRSAPTRLAIDLAARFNITLIGFARGARMNIYTHPERVIAAASDK